MAAVYGYTLPNSLLMPTFRHLLVLGLLILCPLAYAARPMITDDARIVDSKACQAETWVKDNRGSQEFWALPSCNFTGNLEITAGGARTHDATGLRTTDLLLQGKTLFRTLEPNSWDWGLAFGTVSHPDVSRKMMGDLYSYVPVTFSFNDDRVLLHTNIGWAREKATNKHAMTWGVGSEIEMTPRTWLIGETYGENQGRPYFQLGVRHWIVQNRIQLDATYGNRTGGSESWFSIGLRFLSLPFLP